MALHPELQADAQRVLDEAGCPCDEIVAVEYDSILYVNRMGSARTSWLKRQCGTGRLRTLMAEGFPIEPPASFLAD